MLRCSFGRAGIGGIAHVVPIVVEAVVGTCNMVAAVQPAGADVELVSAPYPEWLSSTAAALMRVDFKPT